MVRYSCDLTGATTQIISALGAANHVDECCDDEADDQAFTSTAGECCRATVFSLPPTSPAPDPTHLDAQLTTIVPFADRAPKVTVRLMSIRESRIGHSSVPRNFPLLV